MPFQQPRKMKLGNNLAIHCSFPAAPKSAERGESGRGEGREERGAQNGKLMAITCGGRWRVEAEAGVAPRTYVLSFLSFARSLAACPTSGDENVRRSMKEARLLSDSERASEQAGIALPERGKDLFMEGSSNFGVAELRRTRNQRKTGRGQGKKPV